MVRVFKYFFTFVSTEYFRDMNISFTCCLTEDGDKNSKVFLPVLRTENLTARTPHAAALRSLPLCGSVSDKPQMNKSVFGPWETGWGGVFPCHRTPVCDLASFLQPEEVQTWETWSKPRWLRKALRRHWLEFFVLDQGHHEPGVSYSLSLPACREAPAARWQAWWEGRTRNTEDIPKAAWQLWLLLQCGDRLRCRSGSDWINKWCCSFPMLQA